MQTRSIFTFWFLIKQRKRWIQVREGLVKHICACEGALEWGWQNGGGIHHTKTKLSCGSISLLGLSVVKLAEPDRMIDCFVRVPGRALNLKYFVYLQQKEKALE